MLRELLGFAGIEDIQSSFVTMNQHAPIVAHGCQSKAIHGFAHKSDHFTSILTWQFLWWKMQLGASGP